MDPQSIKKFLIPAVAVAALIVIVAVIISGDTPNKTKSSATSSTPRVAASTDTSDAGMSDAMPTDVNWTVLPGGLKIQDVKEGTGETVSAGQRVNAHYSGWLASNGTPFDSSRKRGAPTEFSLNEVIPGWTNGIPGMKVGGIRRLYIPAAMGYGSRGQSSIPPNSDLVFEVKLIGFQ